MTHPKSQEIPMIHEWVEEIPLHLLDDVASKFNSANTLFDKNSVFACQELFGCLDLLWKDYGRFLKKGKASDEEECEREWFCE